MTPCSSIRKAMVACLVLCAVGLLPLAAQGGSAPSTADFRGATTATEAPLYRYDLAARTAATPSIAAVRERPILGRALAGPQLVMLQPGLVTWFGVAAEPVTTVR